MDENIFSNNCRVSSKTINKNIVLRKTTAAQNEDALNYLRVRGLYFLAVVFVATIVYIGALVEYPSK